MMNDILTICSYRLKIIFKSFFVRVAFVIAILVTIGLIGSFAKVADEKTSIPVGVIDSDNSERSKNIVENLKNVPSLYIIEGEYEELEHQLVEGNVYVIIEINKGFEEFLKEGKKDKLLTQYYISGNKNMSLVSDVVLSQVLDDICYFACIRAYHQHDEYDLRSDKEYQEHLRHIYEEYKGSVDFDFEIVNIESNKNVTDNVSNGIIYKLVMVGIITILVSFITLFASNVIISDIRYNTHVRMNISHANCISKAIGDLLALFITSLIYIILSFIILFGKLGLNSFDEVLQMIIGLVLFNVMVCGVFVLLANVVVKEPVMFQIIGAFTVCLMGIFGSFEIIAVLVPDFMKKLANIIPNVYVVRLYNKLCFVEDGIDVLGDMTIFTLVIVFGMLLLVKAKDFIEKRI